jgi:signal transduction histidine kinase
LEQGLETIERNARVQAQIIEDLLDMSRIISGKVRLDVQRLDLPAVVAEAINTVRISASAKGVRLQTIIDPLNAPVTGDPHRLQQVFWNLLSNAIKFTPKGNDGSIPFTRSNQPPEPIRTWPSD